jgi:diguanylate cyclase (GGDEF)-like protein
MAASDSHPRTHVLPPGAHEHLSATALLRRLEEEVSRAERHGTELSCLLVAIHSVAEAESAYGDELHEQMLTYVAGALQRELRRFDRVGRPSERELLIVLPGADRRHGEMVGRRVLDRLHTIKVETAAGRRVLNASIGLAAWREPDNAEELLRRASAAARAGCSDELGVYLHPHARLDAMAS